MQQENKMGTMPVNKLLVTMSLPMMASMLVQALYNVVDSIFVAHYSEQALTAVSLCFPVQTLMIAFAAGTGVGINSILSRRLGEKEAEKANQTAVNGLLLGVLSSLLFAVLGFCFSDRFFSFFTADAETVRMGRDYMFICTVFSQGLFLQVVAEKLLLSTGRTLLNMCTQIVGALVNLLLDPLLIFGMFGLPALGVAGAAIATVAGQWSAMIAALLLNHFKNRELALRFRGFRPSLRIIGQIHKIGIPSIIMQSIISIMTVGMNKILADDTAISVFGVYYKLHSFVFMPVFGVTNALVPIVAYNFGAKDSGRIIKTLRTAMCISAGIMAIGTAVFLAIPRPLLRLFNAGDELMGIGVPALRIISIGFVFSGISIIFSSCFQALGKAFLSMLVSITRQLVIILPAAFLLKKLFGLHAVWYSMILSEITGAALCILLYLRVYRKAIKPLGQKKEGVSPSG